MSPSSDICRRQNCTKYVILEYLLNAVSLADSSWGDMLEPARNRIYCSKYTMNRGDVHCLFVSLVKTDEGYCCVHGSIAHGKTYRGPVLPSRIIPRAVCLSLLVFPSVLLC